MGIDAWTGEKCWHLIWRLLYIFITRRHVPRTDSSRRSSSSLAFKWKLFANRGAGSLILTAFWNFVSPITPVTPATYIHADRSFYTVIAKSCRIRGQRSTWVERNWSEKLSLFASLVSLVRSFWVSNRKPFRMKKFSRESRERGDLSWDILQLFVRPRVDFRNTLEIKKNERHALLACLRFWNYLRDNY